MAEKNSFDKEMFKKYQKDILEAMGEMENVNLSKSITKLIGFSEKFDMNKLYGFFFWDIHDSHGNYDALRGNACNAVIKLLGLDKRLSSVSFTWRDTYCSSKENRADIRNNNLSIGEHNMENIFSKKDTQCKKEIKNKKTCDKKTCGKQLSIKFKKHSSLVEGKKSELYLPRIILNEGDPLSSIWQEIVSHSVCNHQSNGENEDTIFLLGRNIGSEVECLYALVMEVFPKEVWGVDKTTKKLVAPDHLPVFFIQSGLLPYCDYFIIASQSSDYYAIPVCTTAQNAFEWKKLGCQTFNTRFSKKVCICCNKNVITIKEKNSYSSLELNSNTMAPLPIYHILIFDNHQDKAGGKGNAPPTGD